MVEREKKVYQKIPPPKTPEETIANLKSVAGREQTEASMAEMLERMDLGHIVKKKETQMRARKKDTMLDRAMKVVKG